MLTAHDPTFAFVGDPCCPTFNFVIAIWIMITFYSLLTSLFCIIVSVLNTDTLIFHKLYDKACMLHTSKADKSTKEFDNRNLEITEAIVVPSDELVESFSMNLSMTSTHLFSD
jgi:hypothetical protein